PGEAREAAEARLNSYQDFVKETWFNARMRAARTIGEAEDEASRGGDRGGDMKEALRAARRILQESAASFTKLVRDDLQKRLEALEARESLLVILLVADEQERARWDKLQRRISPWLMRRAYDSAAEEIDALEKTHPEHAGSLALARADVTRIREVLAAAEERLSGLLGEARSLRLRGGGWAYGKIERVANGVVFLAGAEERREIGVCDLQGETVAKLARDQGTGAAAVALFLLADGYPVKAREVLAAAPEDEELALRLRERLR
ncbi:hypothetical protein ACFL59_10110, partial [Planctomycetota bacterium]